MCAHTRTRSDMRKCVTRCAPSSSRMKELSPSADRLSRVPPCPRMSFQIRGFRWCETRGRQRRWKILCYEKGRAVDKDKARVARNGESQRRVQNTVFTNPDKGTGGRKAEGGSDASRASLLELSLRYLYGNTRQRNLLSTSSVRCFALAMERMSNW